MFRPKPLKLGHLVLKVRDIQASLAFYRDVVGLEVSDWIDGHMVFLRAGTDHHDLALLQMPPDQAARHDPASSPVEHFSYQVADMGEMERITAFLKERGVPIDRGYGRHGPGGNTFIVFKDPDGNNVEFYSDMIQVDADHPHTPAIWPGKQMHTFDRWDLEKFVVPPPARIEQLKKGGGK